MKMKVSDLLPYKIKRYTESMNSFVPQEAIIPLLQEKDTTTHCTVNKGDIVKEGQILAKSKVLHGSVVHSSVPGRVSDIGYISDPDGKRVHAVKVKLQGEFSIFGKIRKKVIWRDFSSSTIRKIIADNGVVNTFGRTVSLVHQMDRLMEKSKPTLVVRLFDLDPSCTVDQFIAEQYPDEIIEGINILATAMEAKRVLLIVPQNYEPKNPLNLPTKNISSEGETDSSIHDELEFIQVETDTSFYPVGGKRDIMSFVNKKHRDKRINFKDLYVDSSTIYAVYEAVVYNQPVIDKFVQIAGHAVYGEGILKVRLGTPIRSLIAEFGGFVKDGGKIIINGILMGHNVTDFNTPITKGVKSVIIIPPKDAVSPTSLECIRCGMCRNVCPMGLSPDILYGHYAFKHEISQGYLDTLRNCSDCVLCNAVCPARLPLCQSIKLLRGAVNEKK